MPPGARKEDGGAATTGSIDAQPQQPDGPNPTAGGCSVCIHCGRRAAQGLYREYSRDNIRLTRCAHCGAVADPLVEHEFLLVLLDLVLHKREAYRHLLLNRPPHCALGWRGLLRVAAVLVVLDTHSRYAVYAHASAAAAAASASSTSTSTSSIKGAGTVVAAAAAAGAASGVAMDGGNDDTPAFQLRLILRLVGLTLLEHAAFALLVVGGAIWLVRRRQRQQQQQGKQQPQQQPGPDPRPSPSPSLLLAQKLLQALLYPAFGRLLVPFIMVWDPAVAVAGVIGALVLSSQWQALHAVVTSAPFAAVPGEKGGGGGGGTVETVVALPFLLGLVGRAALRLLLAGRVVALESFLEDGRRGSGSGGSGSSSFEL